MKKILIINLILLVILFTGIEIFSYQKLFNKYKNEIELRNEVIGEKTIIPLGYQKVTIPNESSLLSNFRPTEYRDEDKKPIILFGCSFTEGFGLEENKTFSRKLADYTNRTIFNRGRSGTGLPFLYWQLSNEKVMKELPKNPEYIIFTLIPDHFPRLFRYRNFVLTGDHTLRYKISNNKLKEDKPILTFVHSLFTSIVLEEYLAEKNYQKEYNNGNPLFKKILDESYKLVKENFKDSKFVIIYYKNPFDIDNYTDKIIYDYIEKNKDIVLIDISKEFPNIQKTRDLWLADNDHPSEKAWDMIVPRIVEKLNINATHH